MGLAVSHHEGTEEVILHQVVNAARDSSYDTPVVFDDYKVKKLEDAGVREGWYWYHARSYEGSGFFMGQLKSGEWVWKDLGHCSCYGPLDGIAGDGYTGYGGGNWSKIESPAEFVSRASDEFTKKDAAPVLDAMREKGLL